MHPKRIYDLALGTVVDRRIGLARPQEMPATISPVSNWCLRWATTATSPTLADFTLLQPSRHVAHLMCEHLRFAHHQNVRAGGRLSDYTINLHGRVLRTFAAWLAREEYTEEHVLARFRPLRPKTKPIAPLTPEEVRGLVASLTGPASLRARGRTMLVSLGASAAGATLTAANRVVNLDSWWNPTVMDQATARTHRIGKAKGRDRDDNGDGGHRPRAYSAHAQWEARAVRGLRGRSESPGRGPHLDRSQRIRSLWSQWPTPARRPSRACCASGRRRSPPGRRELPWRCSCPTRDEVRSRSGLTGSGPASDPSRVRAPSFRRRSFAAPTLRAASCHFDIQATVVARPPLIRLVHGAHTHRPSQAAGSKDKVQLTPGGRGLLLNRVVRGHVLALFAELTRPSVGLSPMRALGPTKGTPNASIRENTV